MHAPGTAPATPLVLRYTPLSRLSALRRLAQPAIPPIGLSVLLECSGGRCLPPHASPFATRSSPCVLCPTSRDLVSRDWLSVNPLTRACSWFYAGRLALAASRRTDQSRYCYPCLTTVRKCVEFAACDIIDVLFGLLAAWTVFYLSSGATLLLAWETALAASHAAVDDCAFAAVASTSFCASAPALLAMFYASSNLLHTAMALISPVARWALIAAAGCAPIGLSAMLFAVRIWVLSATLPIACLHIYAASLYAAHIRATLALGRLLTGKVYNPVRDRIGPLDSQPAEIAAAVSLFLIVIVFLPATTALHLALAALRLPILFVESALVRIAAAWRALPWLDIICPARLSGDLELACPGLHGRTPFKICDAADPSPPNASASLSQTAYPTRYPGCVLRGLMTGRPLLFGFALDADGR
eukprot:m.262934 g.262934  ORF g.262934 m.262934 type:complete len:415 (-) comp26204_c0_seq1:188-1432(-)